MVQTPHKAPHLNTYSLLSLPCPQYIKCSSGTRTKHRASTPNLSDTEMFRCVSHRAASDIEGENK